jgi:osmotically-inducible protein OsmY
MSALTDAAARPARESRRVTNRSNRKVVERVVTELEWDPRLDASRIRVRAREGVVFLVGKVRTFAEKWAASRAALRADGVVDVQNAIEIVRRRGDCLNDDELRDAVLRAVRLEPHTPQGLVAVDVRDGRVTLRGVVDLPMQIAAAEAAVRKLPGILGVRNELRLRRAYDAAG